MSSRKYTGIVIGATGAVGTQLVIQLLKSEKWGKILTLTRRDYELPADCGLSTKEMVDSGKLEKKIVDFEKFENEKECLKGYDYMFSCFGTTRKDAGGAEPFMHIDHDYNVNAAKAAREMNVMNYGLVSSVGANPNSYFTYMKCKGLIEEDLKKMNFDRLSIFRPTTLDRGSLARANEKLAYYVMSTIPVSVVAHAMIIQAEKDLEAQEKGVVNVFENKDIVEMAKYYVCFYEIIK